MCPTRFTTRRRAQFSDEELARLTLVVVAINGWNRFNIAFNVPAGSYKAGSTQGDARPGLLSGASRLPQK